MNHIGTHDTERALTVLGGEPMGNRGREWQSTAHLSPEQRQRGILLLRLAAVMQFTLPGVPCIYYGDEAGMEGYKDPFCRRCYPWGSENRELVECYRRLGAMRARCDCLREGRLEPFSVDGQALSYFRTGEKDAIFCAVNRSDRPRRQSICRMSGMRQSRSSAPRSAPTASSSCRRSAAPSCTTRRLRPPRT